jgi:hypothetical protein
MGIRKEQLQIAICKVCCFYFILQNTIGAVEGAKKNPHVSI